MCFRCPTGMIHFALLVDPEEPTLVYAGGTCQLCMPSVLGSSVPTGRLFRGNMYVELYIFGGPGIIVQCCQSFFFYVFFVSQL